MQEIIVSCHKKAREVFATLNYTKTADPGYANELYLLPLPFPSHPFVPKKKIATDQAGISLPAPYIFGVG